MALGNVDIKQADFGVIGLGVMGANLALNIEDHAYSVAVWNRSIEPMREFLAKYDGRLLVGEEELSGFVARLERPRRILLMIKAGDPVDETLELLMPLLEPGDIVIDGGNSWFEDTERRERLLASRDLSFFGMGVSGGEDGARYGPSLMPGGKRESWERLQPVLRAIAASSTSGPCVTYCGPGGAGHFVKMVHNGIEYGDMQLIAEAYDIMRKGLGMSADAISAVFHEWNSGILESYLVEITAKVLAVKEDGGTPLVDRILDSAGQKGTGKWTVKVALNLAVPIPTIAAAVDARFLSAMKPARLEASALLSGPGETWTAGDQRQAINDIGYALFASKICSYAQGMMLLRAASDQYGWGTDLKEIARIWKAGCIIRARLLDTIMKAYERTPGLANLVLDDQIRLWLEQMQPSWRRLISMAQLAGIPAPSLSASLGWFDSIRSARLPQNLTQAQRDAFGAHTYQLLDDPRGTAHHTDWLGAGERE